MKIIFARIKGLKSFRMVLKALETNVKGFVEKYFKKM